MAISKKISILLMCVIMSLSCQTVLASEYSQIDNDEMIKIDLASIERDENGEAIIDLEDIVIAVGPINSRQSRLFSYKYVNLTTSFTQILTDHPMLKTNLQINNYGINPGNLHTYVTYTGGLGYMECYNLRPGEQVVYLSIPAGMYSVYAAGSNAGLYELCLFDFPNI